MLVAKEFSQTVLRWRYDIGTTWYFGKIVGLNVKVAARLFSLEEHHDYIEEIPVE